MKTSCTCSGLMPARSTAAGQSVSNVQDNKEGHGATHTLDGVRAKLGSAQARKGAFEGSTLGVAGGRSGGRTYPKNMPVGVRTAETT